MAFCKAPNSSEDRITDTIAHTKEKHVVDTLATEKVEQVETTNKNIWIAALTNHTAKDELKKLEKDGVLNRFKK